MDITGDQWGARSWTNLWMKNNQHKNTGESLQSSPPCIPGPSDNKQVMSFIHAFLMSHVCLLSHAVIQHVYTFQIMQSCRMLTNEKQHWLLCLTLQIMIDWHNAFKTTLSDVQLSWLTFMSWFTIVHFCFIFYVHPCMYALNSSLLFLPYSFHLDWIL